MKKVAVVIPTYKPEVNYLESFSLLTLNRHLKDYPTYLVTPNSLPSIPKLIQDRTIVRFSDDYFKSVQDYSRLLLSSHFYEKFLNYEYILIYQFDCLVVSDQLKFWIDQDYDYIGAPWLFSATALLTHPEGKMMLSANGGFSLRKVKTHYQLLKDLEDKYPQRGDGRTLFREQLLKFKTKDYWLKIKPEDYPFNEDGFFALEAGKVRDFKMPGVIEGAKFALEKHPRLLMSLTQQLPFGVHAWYRYHPKFWAKKLGLSVNL